MDGLMRLRCGINQLVQMATGVSGGYEVYGSKRKLKRESIKSPSSAPKSPYFPGMGSAGICTRVLMSA